MRSLVALRPQHALCIRFFEGKGYSEDFVDHMDAVISSLQTDDPDIILCGGCDCICEACPRNEDGVCRDSEKVCATDERTLLALGLCIGDTLSWSELYAKAEEAVIRSGRLKEVCRSCQWLYICEKRAE